MHCMCLMVKKKNLKTKYIPSIFFDQCYKLQHFQCPGAFVKTWNAHPYILQAVLKLHKHAQGYFVLFTSSKCREFTPPPPARPWVVIPLHLLLPRGLCSILSCDPSVSQRSGPRHLLTACGEGMRARLVRDCNKHKHEQECKERNAWL